MSLHDDIKIEMHRMVDQSQADIITPASLAQSVQGMYINRRVDPHIEYASLEHLKQIARSVLSGRLDAESDDNEVYQGELFTGRLQTRYPIPRKPGTEPAYKLRDALSEKEITWNIATLRRSAEARLMHADALEAWHRNRAAAA
jgi:hypothetical protein